MRTVLGQAGLDIIKIPKEFRAGTFGDIYNFNRLPDRTNILKQFLGNFITVDHQA